MTYKEEIKSLLTQLAAANSELVRKQDRDSQYSNVCCKLSAKENEVVQLRQRLAEKDAEIERLKTVPMKYRRMAFNAQLQDENEQLRQQLAEKDAEIRKLALDCLSIEGQALEHWTAAAAIQAREQQLREALKIVDGNSNYPITKEALALPSDTTTLEALIAKASEVMQEKCAVTTECLPVGCGLEGRTIAEAIRALPSVTLEDLK